MVRIAASHHHFLFYFLTLSFYTVTLTLCLSFLCDYLLCITCFLVNQSLYKYTVCLSPPTCQIVFAQVFKFVIMASYFFAYAFLYVFSALYSCFICIRDSLCFFLMFMLPYCFYILLSSCSSSFASCSPSCLLPPALSHILPCVLPHYLTDLFCA